MNKNSPNHRQFEIDNKMESDPSQSNSPLISASITKNIAMEEGREILEDDDKSTIAKISKEIYIMKEGLDTIVVQAFGTFEADKAKIKKVYETEKATLQAENTQLQATLVENQEIINQQANIAENQKVEIAQLKESNEKLQAENLGLKNVNASLQKSTETTEKEKAECESKISQLTETCNAKEAEIYSLKNEIASLQTTLNNSVASNSQLQDEKLKLKQELSQINDTKIALNVEIRGKAGKIQKLDTQICQLKNENTALTKENKYLKSLTPSFCKIEDVVVNGKIDYRRLNGKFPIVDKIEQKVNGKLYADDYEISFEYQNFKVFVNKEIEWRYDFDIPLHRLCFINLNCLFIHNSKIKYSDFKEFIAKCNNVDCFILARITVVDENGKVIGIDQLLKDISETNCVVKAMEYGFNDDENVSHVAQKLSRIPLSPNIRKFKLLNIPANQFDLKKYCEFIKRNPLVEYELVCYGSDKYYTQIKNLEKELRPTLPETCKLYVSRSLFKKWSAI